MTVYYGLAVAALVLHLVWILWVILGWLVTRNRSWLRWLHLLSVVYGILIEIFFWPCPLTYLEQWFRFRAGFESYQEDFLIHYLEALVYPDISPILLTWIAVPACLLILGVYVGRFQRRGVAGW